MEVNHLVEITFTTVAAYGSFLCGKRFGFPVFWRPYRNFVAIGLPAGLAIGLGTLGRAAAIYPCCLLFSRSSLPVTAKHQNILFAGVLRGALALALSLGLPTEVPHREEIISISFAVVAFSAFVQDLTITPLLRRMGRSRQPNRPAPHSLMRKMTGLTSPGGVQFQ